MHKSLKTIHETGKPVAKAGPCKVTSLTHESREKFNKKYQEGSLELQKGLRNHLKMARFSYSHSHLSPSFLPSFLPPSVDLVIIEVLVY